MNKNLQEKLFNKYPKIFRQKDLTIQESAMSFGICCPDKWYDLIDGLCASIQKYCDSNQITVQATQVKEKFGELRFYVNTNDCYILDIIDVATSLSVEI